ncbi:MAG: alpha/beta hydrolase [Clostridia bacterium]|nr:alpha/beta hydrolase [Clostridia bacterium]
MKKKIIKVLIAVAVVVAVMVGAMGIYLGDYYKAQVDAEAVFAPEKNVKITTIENGNMVFVPENPVAGFVFYPGGKVEYTSYKPLMEACASRGIACVIVKMPFNLAVFDVNGAEGITDMYPEISEWYIGGHSLGGSMAASYISENSDEYKGLVLLGSYSTADLSEKKIDVLSVFGSEDKVMNKEKYNESKINLPANFEEVIIEGGCHAYFGMYGAQDGDGTPTISNVEQINTTADLICDFLTK